MKRAFILTECLIAAALAAIFLPMLAQRFSDGLRAAEAMRRTMEAHSIAASSLERSQALRESGTSGEFRERLSGSQGVFDVAVTVENRLWGPRATAEVKWLSGGGTCVFRLSRCF